MVGLRGNVRAVRAGDGPVPIPVALRRPAAAPLRRYLRVMALRVECSAGAGGEPEPSVVWFGSRRVGVRAVVDRWFAPTQRWFKIDADDDQLYVLRHDEARGEWDLAALTRRDG
jgi:hypothetical protein